MLRIPSIANIKPVKMNIQLGIGTPIVETGIFQWNVEAAVNKTLSFSYFIGEGPLYWFRIDWYPQISACSVSCVSVTPVIDTSPCPFDIVDSCLILPPICSCTPSCKPGDCISQTVEVWHMLATSVEDLCERINTECCPSKPKGYIRRVRQFMRPALCCDVAKNKGHDEYVDVDFIKCECGNLVDPCIARIVYPCDINQCGIHGPVPSMQVSQARLAENILGHMPMALAMGVSTDFTSAIALVPPKEKVVINNISTRFGLSVPMALNASVEGIVNLGDIKLHYNRDYKSWIGSKTVKDLKVNLELGLIEHGEEKDFGYKLNLLFDKNNKKTKVGLIFKSKRIKNNSGVFEINLDLDNKLIVKTPETVLQSKILKDDLGMFNSKGNFKIKIRP